MNRVVITGMGAYSCLGENIEVVKESLIAGKSGIGVSDERAKLGYRSSLMGMVKRPILKSLLSRRERVGLGEPGEYAFMSTKEALENAGIDMDFLEKNEVGILFGNDSTGGAIIAGNDKFREKKDSTLIGSGAIFQQMNCTVTMNLSTIYKLRGINFTVSGACASGSHAIGLGYLMIAQGLQNCIVCGGAQELDHWSMASFDGLGAFSINHDNPKEASKPFDKNRDGLVPSGGAATVILESYEHAKKRGANILGELVGYGFSSNGQHISKPNSEGSSIAMQRALKMAKMQASEIEYINAHATSTPLGDLHEATAILDVFGESKPYVSSTKSMTGHECWMAGASEIVYSLLMLNNGFIAPNINLEEPDDTSAKMNIVRNTIFKDFNVFLSNSFGFGGTNSALIIKGKL